MGKSDGDELTDGTDFLEKSQETGGGTSKVGNL